VNNEDVNEEWAVNGWSSWRERRLRIMEQCVTLSTGLNLMPSFKGFVCPMVWRGC